MNVSKRTIRAIFTVEKKLKMNKVLSVLKQRKEIKTAYLVSIEFSTFEPKFYGMEVNKADLLKNIQNFIERNLAIKEAQHQIGIFKAVYEQVEAYEKLEEKEDTLIS